MLVLNLFKKGSRLRLRYAKEWHIVKLTTQTPLLMRVSSYEVGACSGAWRGSRAQRLDIKAWQRRWCNCFAQSVLEIGSRIWQPSQGAPAHSISSRAFTRWLLS